MRRFLPKRAAPALLAFFMAASLPAPAGREPLPPSQGNTDLAGELSASFNRSAVEHLHELPCGVRDDRRRFNVERPSHWRTPSYFRYQGERMALYSPDLTEKEKQQAQAILDRVPPHVMDLLYTEGAVFVFTAHSLVEALPGYARVNDGEHYPYYEYYAGLYRTHERRILVTFHLANLDKETRRPAVTGYRPLYDRERVVNHEIGHFIDDILGELGAPRQEKGSVRFSEREAFARRVAEDLDAITAAHLSAGELRRLSYFLPESHNGVKLFGERRDARNTQSEVFAELWAEAQGHGLYNLGVYFPRAYALVQEANEELKRLQLASDRTCDYDIHETRRMLSPPAAP